MIVSRYHLLTFGGLRVLDETGRQVLLSARKAAALLAYLALHPGRPQPRARLAALLWGSSGEAASRASLRQAVLVVRRTLALGSHELITGPGETLMLAAGTARVDALELEAAIAEPAPPGGPAPLEELLNSIDGEFLEGLDAHEPAFDEWLAQQRHALRTRLAQAHRQQLDTHRAVSRTDAAIASALRLLALEPLGEEVHRLLMELYALQHRWGAALQQFQLCRGVLARELGVRPQTATLQLRDAIERQRAQAEPGDRAAVGQPATASAELRHVALLAAESARAADEPDPERAQQLADATLHAVAEMARRFGGTLQRRAGGMALVCFGAPHSHGDDDERAARCALRLVEEAPGLRVALAAGLALVAPATDEQEASIGGEVAGMATRLLGAAAPGEVLVAEPLWRSLAGLATIAEGQRCPDAALPVALRGMGIHRLGALRRHPERRAALVGRRAELAQFATLIDSCLRDGTGAVLHVRGEPGMGKTRLAEEFRAHAAGRGFAVHLSTVLGFGSGAERDAVRSLVSDLLRIDAADGSEPAVAAGIDAAVSDGLGDAQDRAALWALLRQAPPPGMRAIAEAMDHAGRARMQREALARLVSRSAARAPRLVVLEDLHWADGETLAHAAALAAVTASAPVVLVTTSRSDADPLDAAWRQSAATSAVATLDIGPLRWVEASTLASQLADAADPFTLRCVERAGGNPLFLEHLLQAGRSDAEGLPATVQTVLQARLDRLAPPEREALRVGSVLGQRFAMAALDHLLDAPAAWDPKRAMGLLRADGSEAVFAHALVREGSYASLPRARRRELHAKAARWFEGRDIELRAEQLEGAEDAAAAAAWLDAATAAAAALRHGRAAELAACGLALPQALGAVRFALGCCRAEALHQVGHNADAHMAWQGALQAAPGDAERCQAWLGIAAALRLRDDLDGAAAALDRAAALAEALGLDEALARVHLQRGNLLFPRGDLDGCRREHGASLALARRAGSTEVETAALGGLGDADYLSGHMLSAARRFGSCVELARRRGLRRVEAANQPMAAWTRWFAGDVQGALADVEQGIVNARAIGHLRAEAIAHHIGCLARQALGESETARAHAEQALDLARRLEAPRFEAEALAFLGDLDAANGDADGALARLHQALAIARASGMAFMGPVYLGLLARACAGDAVARQAALDEAEHLLASNGLAHNHLLFRRIAIDVCLAAIEPDAARRHGLRLAEYTRAEPLPWSEFLIGRGQALADVQQGLNGDGLHARLSALADEGERLGLAVDSSALRDALARSND